MNNSIIFGIIALIIVSGGVFTFLNNKEEATIIKKSEMMDVDGSLMEGKDKTMTEQGNDAMMEKEEGVMMEKKDGAMMDKGDGMMKSGSYEVYSPDKITKAATGDVVLFFRASWCPTCRAVDTDIRAHLTDIPETLTILDVNYDNSTSLKQKYGVTYQHTFVQVDAQGNQIKKWTGSPTLAALISEVK